MSNVKYRRLFYLRRCFFLIYVGNGPVSLVVSIRVWFCIVGKREDVTRKPAIECNT